MFTDDNVLFQTNQMVNFTLDSCFCQKGKIDPLIGLKENVIIGKLIPAGTGMKRYRNIKLNTDVNEEEELSFDDFDGFDEAPVTDEIEETEAKEEVTASTEE